MTDGFGPAEPTRTLVKIPRCGLSDTCPARIQAVHSAGVLDTLSMNDLSRQRGAKRRRHRHDLELATRIERRRAEC